MVRRLAAGLLILLALLPAGCVTRLVHSPQDAATSAQGFLNVLLIEKDAAGAYEMLDPGLAKTTTASKLADSVKQSPGYGRITSVKATDYQPVLGQPAMDIYLTGKAGDTSYYYVLRMNGTADTEYRPASLRIDDKPFPSSDMRQALPQ